MKYLISQDFDVNEQNDDDETPLHRAASYGDLAVFKVIWTLAVDKNPKDNNGMTPLHISCQNGHRLIVKFITSRISDADPKSNDGTSILHSAAASGNLISQHFFNNFTILIIIAFIFDFMEFFILFLNILI